MSSTRARTSTARSDPAPTPQATSTATASATSSSALRLTTRASLSRIAAAPSSSAARARRRLYRRRRTAAPRTVRRSENRWPAMHPSAFLARQIGRRKRRPAMRFAPLLLCLAALPAAAQDAPDWSPDLDHGCSKASKEGKLVLLRQIVCDCTAKECMFAEVVKSPWFLQDADTRALVTRHFVAVAVHVT